MKRNVSSELSSSRREKAPSEGGGGRREAERPDWCPKVASTSGEPIFKPFSFAFAVNHASRESISAAATPGTRPSGPEIVEWRGT
ncbi:hypothetical protein O3P69_005709 [Scylla paramamosain]|uniref:Uncharacterized protein n=1 Tax=Scylla paramamosain TaxID=85552 RepID=A0AAW0U6T6_SCYPA